jgi:hypothetical protein
MDKKRKYEEYARAEKSEEVSEIVNEYEPIKK